MKKMYPLKYLLFLSFCIHLGAKDFQQYRSENWHHWRGPDANGVSKSANPPLHWGENKNIRWKVPMEGDGMSTPIIWKDKIFLLSAINTGKIDPLYLDQKISPSASSELPILTLSTCLVFA